MINDPFAPFTKAFETWQKMADDSYARTAAFYAQLDELDAKNVERTENAIKEIAKLTKETLAYQAQLGAEWRKLSLETMKASAKFTADKA
jgi:hypothetical protein